MRRQMGLRRSITLTVSVLSLTAMGGVMTGCDNPTEPCTMEGRAILNCCKRAGQSCVSSDQCCLDMRCKAPEAGQVYGVCDSRPESARSSVHLRREADRV